MRVTTAGAVPRGSCYVLGVCACQLLIASQRERVASLKPSYSCRIENNLASDTDGAGPVAALTSVGELRLPPRNKLAPTCGSYRQNLPGSKIGTMFLVAQN